MLCVHRACNRLLRRDPEAHRHTLSEAHQRRQIDQQSPHSVDRQPSLHLLFVGLLRSLIRLLARRNHPGNGLRDDGQRSEMAGSKDGSGNVPLRNVGRLERDMGSEPASSQSTADGGANGESRDQYTAALDLCPSTLLAVHALRVCDRCLMIAYHWVPEAR